MDYDEEEELRRQEQEEADWWYFFGPGSAEYNDSDEWEEL